MGFEDLLKLILYIIIFVIGLIGILFIISGVLNVKIWVRDLLVMERS